MDYIQICWFISLCVGLIYFRLINLPIYILYILAMAVFFSQLFLPFRRNSTFLGHFAGYKQKLFILKVYPIFAHFLHRLIDLSDLSGNNFVSIFVNNKERRFTII